MAELYKQTLSETQEDCKTVDGIVGLKSARQTLAKLESKSKDLQRKRENYLMEIDHAMNDITVAQDKMEQQLAARQFVMRFAKLGITAFAQHNYLEKFEFSKHAEECLDYWAYQTGVEKPGPIPDDYIQTPYVWKEVIDIEQEISSIDPKAFDEPWPETESAVSDVVKPSTSKMSYDLGMVKIENVSVEKRVPSQTKKKSSSERLRKSYPRDQHEERLGESSAGQIKCESNQPQRKKKRKHGRSQEP